MKINKFSLILSLCFGLSAASSAIAAPQTGTWLIANGENAYGGDIINIDAQDNTVFVIFAAGEVPNNTYFLYGRGVLNNDNLEVDLVSSKDGSTRRISGYFNTSVTGTLNFPGVGQRSVYRVKLNNEANPQSMLGLWNFSYTSLSTGLGVSQLRIFNSVGKNTTNGSGIVLDGSQTFGCEFQISGELTGYTICADTSNPSQTKGFLLRRSANEAGGVYLLNGSSNYLGMAQRMASSDGKTPLLLKDANASQNILFSAIEDFSYNYGAVAKQSLLKQESKQQ